MSIFVPVFFDFRMHSRLLVLYEDQFVLFRCLPLLFGSVWHDKMAFFWSARALGSDRNWSCSCHLRVDRPINATLCRQRSGFWIFARRNRTLCVLIIAIRRCSILALLKHSDFWQDLIRLFHLLLLRLEVLMSLGERCESFLIRYLFSMIIGVCELI